MPWLWTEQNTEFLVVKWCSAEEWLDVVKWTGRKGLNLCFGLQRFLVILVGDPERKDPHSRVLPSCVSLLGFKDQEIEISPFFLILHSTYTKSYWLNVFRKFYILVLSFSLWHFFLSSINIYLVANFSKIHTYRIAGSETLRWEK